MNTALSCFLLAASGEEVTTMILGGGILFFRFIIGIFLFIFCILLIIAPLRIWHWTKRVWGEVSELRVIMRNAEADRKKEEKRKMQYIEAIYKHLVSIDEALHPEGESEPSA